MTYQPYLIANFATGYDKELQPWLIPEDAQDELFDGYVYRGVWQKREGYDQLAIGGEGSAPYCESRMVHQISGAAMTGVIDSANQTYTLAGSTPIRRGTFVVTGTVPAQSVTDDGLGTFTGDGTGTIDYTTGAVSITFNSAPTAGTVTATYDVHQGLPVMGVMNFFSDTNTNSLIVADEMYVNRLNTVTNRLDDISPTVLLSGDKYAFMSWTNYPTQEDTARLLFVNNVDPIQQYKGGTSVGAVTPYEIYLDTGTAVTAATFFTPTTVAAGPYSWATPVGVQPGSVTVYETFDGKSLTDDGFGGLSGTGTGTINYQTGECTVTFDGALTAGQTIQIDYTPLSDAIDTALHIFQYKDRLVVLRPTISGVDKGRRILISGTGALCDIFTQDAVGAGFIDIPDQTFIVSADFNRDDLLIFTESTVWSLKYTGNDITPFELKKIDGTRGSSSPYGTITYLNNTTTQSPLGFVSCDGYTVERTDDKIPRFSFDEIDQDTFSLCFAGSVDEDRDHYLIYPSSGQAAASSKSDRILITNYEEFNYSIYRIPLSCMGTYIESFDITWDDLARFNTWEEMAAEYGSWDAFAYTKGTPFAVGGGHEGQIFRLNVTESQDYPVKIRDITVLSDTSLQVTTDFQNYAVGDWIYFAAVSGTTEINNKQGFITSIDTANYTFTIQVPQQTYSAFTTDTIGTASKVIVFEAKTKQFNPFAANDKKVRCGWVYFYVSTTDTFVTDNDGNPVDGLLTAQVFVNNKTNSTTLYGSPHPTYQINLSDIDSSSTGYETKKWYKLWVNQTGKFIQLYLSNAQAGAQVKIHALMPGFAPVGRLV